MESTMPNLLCCPTLFGLLHAFVSKYGPHLSTQCTSLEMVLGSQLSQSALLPDARGLQMRAFCHLTSGQEEPPIL